MRKNLAVGCFAFMVGVLGATFVAQDAHATATVNTAKGSCSWLFKFNGLSDLSTSSYKGGIGARHFISDRTAIRPMILFGVHSDKVKPVTESQHEVKNTEHEFGAEITLEKHSMPVGPVSPYVGVQGGVNVTGDKTEVQGSEDAAVKNTSTNFGVGVVGGFLWGFGEAVTLGGEYTVSASFGSGNRKVGDTKTADTSRTDFGIGTASLFVSIAMK